MTTLRGVLAAALVATSACAADEPVDGGDEYTADASDFDAKADGISGSSHAVLSLIDGAHTRLYAQLPTLADTNLISHLKRAAARGVDVHAYVVLAHAAHAETVLAAEQTEASGVDIIADRTGKLPGFLALADDTLLVTTSGKTDSDADHVAAAADRFTAAIAEDISAAPPAVGSDYTALMIMPDAGPGPIVQLIAGAKASIDLELYQLQSPAAIAALTDAAGRGVAVRVMLEPKTVGFVNYQQVVPRLQAAGVQVQATPPAFDSSHNVDHAKFMILDGRELVLGSGNLVRSGLGGNRALEVTNRDFWVRDRRFGSVDEAKALFAADWARTSTTGTTFDALVVSPDNAADAIGSLLDGAHQRVYVYNQSLSDASTIDRLIAAKQRGADVHVLLGYQPGFNGGAPANQPAIDRLTAAGVTAGYFTAHYLHGKVIVADGAAFVGSQNFTAGGLVHNRELGEVLTSPSEVTALAEGFLADEAHPTP